MSKNTKSQVILYTDENGKVELSTDAGRDTLWATMDQIAKLFQVSKSNISMHLKNIFKSRELKENSVVKDFLTTAKDSKQYLVRFYNLDVIIAVGYRVNSKKATKFRIWATGILRDYLINGFNLDESKLASSGQSLEDLHKAIAFIESDSQNGKLKAKISVRLTKDLVK